MQYLLIPEDGTSQVMKFKLGQQVSRSISIINIRTPQGDHFHIALDMNVMKINIPLIVGLEVLKSRSLLANNVENKLEFLNLKISRPLTYKSGHEFSELDQKCKLLTPKN